MEEESKNRIEIEVKLECAAQQGHNNESVECLDTVADKLKG